MTDDSERGLHERDDRGGDEAPPLPGSWLPDPVAPEGDEIWDLRAARIMAAAEADWSRTLAEAPSAGWVTELARWWRPTVALAAAAAAVLVMIDAPPSGSGGASRDGVAFDLIASDGDPVAFWAALGVSADPVLALIALESPADADAPPPPDPRPEGGIR